MSIGLLFWIIFVIWVLFGVYWGREDIKSGNYGGLVLVVLLFLLGWGTFGFIVRGP